MSKSKNIFKKVAKVALSILAVYLVYIIFMLIYGSITDYQPEEKITVKQELALNKKPNSLSQKNVFKLINWNIGYFGLGDKADFFYDVDGFFTNAGKMVHSTEAQVKEYSEGIIEFLKKHQDSDFILLQEVDSLAKRSYYMNGVQYIAQNMPDYLHSFALNYNSDFVPIPLLMPWNTIGKVHSGLMTLSKYVSTENTRYQYPGEFSWPLKIFNLDRCMLVSRIPLENKKDLVVINTHLSAYDAGGVLKKQEMAYLSHYIQQEYNKGNYVIVGADWNQCPPHIKSEMFFPDNLEHNPGNIEADFLPEGWTWSYDINYPTNRKLYEAYKAKQTFSNLIDYYLVSPNIEVLKVNTFDLEFKYSDHQPVGIEIKLKDFEINKEENINQ